MATKNAWQEKCTAELLRCLQVGGKTGAAQWDIVRRDLVQQALKSLPNAEARVVIADCDLRQVSLKDWRFDHCYITRTDFTDANLSNANFDRAMLRGCRLVRANLRGAQFARASIDEQSLGWSVVIDKRTNLAFTGNPENLSGFDPNFRRRANEDQKIFDLKSSKKDRLINLWLWTIDYGRSFWRVTFLLLIISVIFGSIYFVLFLMDPSTFAKGEWTALDFYLMSGQRIINAPALIDGNSGALQFLFLLESSVGYASLALLSAVLLRKLTLFE